MLITPEPALGQLSKYEIKRGVIYFEAVPLLSSFMPNFSQGIHQDMSQTCQALLEHPHRRGQPQPGGPKEGEGEMGKREGKTGRGRQGEGRGKKGGGRKEGRREGDMEERVGNGRRREKEGKAKGKRK